MFRYLARAGIALSLLLAGCSGGPDTGACRDAATAQAEAERVWASIVEDHSAAHVNETGDHPELDGLLISARVDMIIAVEATRRACQ